MNVIYENWDEPNKNEYVSNLFQEDCRKLEDGLGIMNDEMRNEAGEEAKKYVAEVMKDQDKVLELLIGYGADVDKQDFRGESPLMAAVKHNAFNCVVALIAAGAKVNLVNFRQESALHFAARSEDRLAILEKLVRSGADLLKEDIYGSTAFRYATDSDMVKFLEVEMNWYKRKGFALVYKRIMDGAEVVGSVRKVVECEDLARFIASFI